MFVYNRSKGSSQPDAPARDTKSRNLKNFVVLLAGQAVAGWIAIGYAGTNPLALAVTLLIGACYLAGAFELLALPAGDLHADPRLSGLCRSAGQPGHLAGPAGAQPCATPTRLRIEGERAGLPCPLRC